MRGKLRLLLGVASAILGMLVLAPAVQADDPEYGGVVFRWVDDAPDPTDGILDFKQEDLSQVEETDAGGGDFEFVDECAVDLFMSCDRYDGKAPIIKADPTGTYPDGSFAAYTYDIPSSPKGVPFAVQVDAQAMAGESWETTETDGPVAFIAILDDEENTIAFESEEGSNNLQAVVMGEDEPAKVMVGMYARDPQTLTENHWVGLDSIGLYYEDPVPSGTIHWPTGWIDENYEGIPIEAEDHGLGLVATVLFGQKRSPAHLFDWYAKADQYCTLATLFDGCPMELPSGYKLAINPLAMKEGYSSAGLVVGNAFNLGFDLTSQQLKIDTQLPTSSLGGSFTTAPGMVLDGALYELEIDTTDGNPSGTHNSGVKTIQVLVDNVEIDSDTQSCPGDDCTMELDTDIEPDNWSNGVHTLTVKVTDQVGHVKTQNVEFEVDR